MAIDIDRRLERLRDRRQGPMALGKAMDTLLGTKVERYERRTSNKATKYALGAMEEVDPDYTANSIAEGDRVKNQLSKGLSTFVPVAFEYQGSVPLNVHIRGVSDIDLLTLRTDFITYDPTVLSSQTYLPWKGESPATLVAQLRTECEALLRSAFPEVTVEISGSKSIALTGGSLRRKVDVVPSHWHDTAVYQLTKAKKERAVQILIKDEARTMKNLPFMHMAQIDDRDLVTGGGTKKLIRLLKNLRSDSDYSEHIKLSSYDIASLVWHFDSYAITVQPWAELSLLAAAQRALSEMVANKAETMTLRTPDGSRPVIDSEAKFSGLQLLSLEVDQLAEAAGRELENSLAGFGITILTDMGHTRRKLREAYIPG